MATKSSSNELKISRVFDAPIEAVWDAWTDLEQVAQWWGPRGFTITTHSKDLRPGGTWVYTMHGPDGTDYPNITTYLEVREREALVYDHGASEGRPPLFRVTVYFRARGEQTEMDMTMTLATAEVAAEIKKHIKRAGGESTWDRLAEYVEKATLGREVFVINRSFAAPAEEVFGMWTDPGQLAKWLPPEGMEMEVAGGGIAAGETLVSRMFGAGIEFYFRLCFREVGAGRLVYTQEFCEKDGRVSRHPFSPVWPETMLIEVLFTEEGEGQSRVTLRCEASGAVTAEELDVFLRERGGMTRGWSGSFDKMEEMLAG